jgi:hypothetical protein
MLIFKLPIYRTIQNIFCPIMNFLITMNYKRIFILLLKKMQKELVNMNLFLTKTQKEINFFGSIKFSFRKGKRLSKLWILISYKLNSTYGESII